MSSHFRIKLALGAGLIVLGGCHKKGDAPSPPSQQGSQGGVVASSLYPGLDHSVVTIDPRAAKYYDNAAAVNDGMKLYKAYNCSGCHSNGGGGMAPALMDDQWIYGGRLEQIHQTIIEGRPNGMPSWGGKIPDEQIWEIAAYVRSMSLPATLAAQTGPTPSQNPAPVPRAADEHAGWSPPPATASDYGSTMEGPTK
jgi:cytochrome c oxidase cbb3-type subunit 3